MGVKVYSLGPNIHKVTMCNVLFTGLSYQIFKGITRKGYKIPTPIQRKVTIMSVTHRHSTLTSIEL